MSNKPARKVIETAVTLTMTAILATMPVAAASLYVNATSSGAVAHALGITPTAYAELSCEYGGVPKYDNDPDNNNEAYARVVASEGVNYGEILSTSATAWAHGEEAESDYWQVGMN